MKRVTIALTAALLLVTAVAMPTIRAIAQEAVVTDDNLDQALVSAKTAADHEAIAQYYDKQVAENEDKAKLHHATHHYYENFKIKPIDMAKHCDELAKYYQRVADEDKKLAAGHREMAKKVGGQ